MPGRTRWDLDVLCEVVRAHALQTLADPEAVLALDVTGYLEQGKASFGGARQYTGSAGEITNCQIGVFAAYVSRHGHALLDRPLYLPKAWSEHPTRRVAAHVPDAVSFATKPRLALGMMERAIAAGEPFAWVVAETVCAVGEIVMALRQQRLCVRRHGRPPRPRLGCPAPRRGHRRGRRQGPAALLLASALRRQGPKGPRLHDWANLELAYLKVDTYGGGYERLWTVGY